MLFANIMLTTSIATIWRIPNRLFLSPLKRCNSAPTAKDIVATKLIDANWRKTNPISSPARNRRYTPNSQTKIPRLRHISTMLITRKMFFFISKTLLSRLIAFYSNYIIAYFIHICKFIILC